MENVPKTIYLQIGEDCPNDVDFNELIGISWCEDKINENDIEFKLVISEGNQLPSTESKCNKHIVTKRFNPPYFIIGFMVGLLIALIIVMIIV